MGPVGPSEPEFTLEFSFIRHLAGLLRAVDENCKCRKGKVPKNKLRGLRIDNLQRAWMLTSVGRPPFNSLEVSITVQETK